MTERILDIGIGAGGAYIHRHTKPDETRVGVDISTHWLKLLKQHFPEVMAVTASAKKCPFPDDFFSRAEIVLPSGILATSGLQKNLSILSQRTKENNAKRYPHGWYEELQRVLVPEGTLTIFGDFLVEPDGVRETAKGFFEVEYSRQLPVDELRALGTMTVSRLIEFAPNVSYFKQIGKRWEDTLVEIKLRSTKQT